MRRETFDKYHLLTAEYMMGPSAIRLLDEMLDRFPLEHGLRIMDLGCGTGLSSLYLAQETDARVFAVDLWCSASDNHRRFVKWGVEENVVPIHANALDLPFADEYFDAVVSVDAYHYFACNPDYFAQKLLPLVKRGGKALIVVPGLHEEFTGKIPEEMMEWAGEEYTLFHSCEWWKDAIGKHEDIAWAEFTELSCDEAAWEEWFASGHKYSVRDKQFFDRGVGRYMNFVGIAIRKAV